MKKIILILIILQHCFAVPADSKHQKESQKSRPATTCDRVLLAATGAILIVLGCKSYRLVINSCHDEQGLKKLAQLHCSGWFAKQNNGMSVWDVLIRHPDKKAVLQDLVCPLRGLHTIASLVLVTLGGYLINKALTYQTQIINPSK